jgi:hypothetical protein
VFHLSSWTMVFIICCVQCVCVWALWLRVVSTSVVVFLYRGSLPRSPKLSLYLLEVPGLRVLAPLLVPVFIQFNQMCPRKFGVRNTWRGFSGFLSASLL